MFQTIDAHNPIGQLDQNFQASPLIQINQINHFRPIDQIHQVDQANQPHQVTPADQSRPICSEPSVTRRQTPVPKRRMSKLGRSRLLSPYTSLGSGIASIGWLVLLICGGCQPAEPGSSTTKKGSQSAIAGSEASGPSAGTPTPVRPPIRARDSVPELPAEIVIFDTVFWEPRDTDSLRQRIVQSPLIRDAEILEIGTGSGLVALCCLQAGARRVVATDVNPNAIANARYNAEFLHLNERLETRLVPLTDRSATAVLRPEERFDLIVSNPPWEDEQPAKIDQYALYDERFVLLDSILRALPERLKPGGRAWLAYGHRPAVERILSLSAQLGFSARILDERPVDQLPRDFLPGMLIEIQLPIAPQRPLPEPAEQR